MRHGRFAYGLGPTNRFPPPSPAAAARRAPGGGGGPVPSPGGGCRRAVRVSGRAANGLGSCADACATMWLHGYAGACRTGFEWLCGCYLLGFQLLVFRIRSATVD